MLDAFIYDWKRREEERRNQVYDDSRPRAEIGIPNENLIDDRKQRYDDWVNRQTPKSEYGPVPVDLDIAKPSQPMKSYTLEGRL